MSTEQNLDLVRRAVAEIWNGLDLDLADTLFAPAYVNHGGLIPDLIVGPESLKFAVVLQHIAFPRLHVLVRALIAEEDLVELRWIAGRRSASSEDPAGTGRRMARGTTLIRCAGDRIAESWTTWICLASKPTAAEDMLARRPSATHHQTIG